MAMSKRCRVNLSTMTQILQYWKRIETRPETDISENVIKIMLRNTQVQ